MFENKTLQNFQSIFVLFALDPLPQKKLIGSWLLLYRLCTIRRKGNDNTLFFRETLSTEKHDFDKILTH